ncbi:tetratricopeptide repeat protein [Nocardiopsis sp. ARC36]
MDTDGPSDRAEALYIRSVAAWRRIGSGPGLAQALYELGRARLRLHDPSAEEDVRAALEVWERCGAEGRYGRSLSLDQLGVLRHKAGDNEGALEAYHRALAGFTALGEQEGVARALNHIGVSQNRLGRYEAAEGALTRAMALYKALGDLRSEAQVLVNAARIHFHRGRHREVRRMCERGLEAFLSLGDVRSVAQTLNNLGQLAEYLQRYDEGLARFREAKELFTRVGDTAEELNAEAGIGSTLLGLGRVTEALEVVAAGLERIRVLRDPMVEAHLLVVLGDVHVARRRYAEARLQYRNARELAGGGVSRLDEGLAWDRLGDLYSREGCANEADEHWEQAVRILAAVPTPHCSSIRMKLEISAFLRTGSGIAL